MKRIEIKNLRGEILFACSSENNTILKTLEKAVRDGVNLAYADLRDVSFKGGRFKGGRFRDADLRCSDFSGADFRRANFIGANCLGVDFTGADCRGADLRGAYYYKKQIDSAITDEKTRFWDN